GHPPGQEVVPERGSGAAEVDVSAPGPGDGRPFHDEEESPDATPTGASAARLDVTPRARPSEGGRSAGNRRMLAVGGVVLLLGALGMVLFNGLNDAALFYYNVDEALDQRGDLGDQRFRMQGNVIEG